jgi:hypothetical protein
MHLMKALVRSSLSTLLGIATVCALLGCAESKAPDKPAAAPGKALGSADAPKTDTAKQEPQVAKTTPAEDAKELEELKAVRAKLSPEERKLVEAQEWCAINNEEHLGSMGAPVKVMIKGEPVFLCCKSCQKDAEAHPDQTLAKVKELKAKKVAEAKK